MKTFMTVVLFVAGTGIALAGEGGEIMQNLVGKKAVFVIASKDFRDEEFFSPRERLSKAGARVIVASSTTNEVRGMVGRRVKPDVLLNDVSIKDADGIVFVGGSGASEFFTNAVAHKLAIDANSEGKVVAAICVAPVIIANAGLLKGKKAACFPSVRQQVEKGGAKVEDVMVVRQGNIVTACGPEAADEFAVALVAAFAAAPRPQASTNAPAGGGK